MAKAKEKELSQTSELLGALDVLEKEKNISKETLLKAIEQSLLQACKNHFGTSDNVKVVINPTTGVFRAVAEKTVVEKVENPALEISLAKAREKSGSYEIGDIVPVEIHTKEFGRIATQNAKNVILQTVREEERKALFEQFNAKQSEIVSGIVQRVQPRNVRVNLGKAEALLTESEMVESENYQVNDRMKFYVVEVKESSKGPKITLSRTHPGLVKRLFENEVAEVKDGTVEIRSIAREAGKRTKIAVWSNNEDVDPVGACVGMNGARVNAVVKELQGEKIDIVNWDENPAFLIENALSPAKVIYVITDNEEKKAKVVVPDFQLSLAIGKDGQNVRLATRLTGYGIDIKSESQAREAGDFIDLEEYSDDYEEDYEMKPEAENFSFDADESENTSDYQE